MAMLWAVALLTQTGCSGAQFFLANAGTRGGHVERHASLAYGEGPRRGLDVYEMPGTGAARPIVIFWYGGSWETGRKGDYRFVGTTLAQQGFVAVVPDYRLYPEVRFPQFEEDGVQAIAWVQAHAREFGADPRKIVLMGHSAGAHTAAFLAFDHQYLSAHGVDPAAIRGFIGLSGPYELVPDTDNLRRAFAAPYTERDWQPLRFVDSQSPPSLLLHGLADREVIPQESIDLNHALEQNHIAVELHLYPHRGHGATVAPFAGIARWRTPVVSESARFVRQVTADRVP